MAKHKIDENDSAVVSAPELPLNELIGIVERAKGFDGRYCFILGSGASKAAGIKTGVDMAKEWLNELNNIYTTEELRARMERLNVKNIEPNSDNYFSIYELRYEPEYREGNAYLEKEIDKGQPSLGHYTLAKILADGYHNLVITTNFDSLVEDSLFIYTDKRPIVVGHESLTEYINMNSKRPIVAKLHRSLYFGPFNSEEDTAALVGRWGETLKAAFNLYTPVVIGYAGGDQSLMTFLESDDCHTKGLYWCYRKGSYPPKRIVDLVKKRDGRLVPIDGFDQMMFMFSVKLKYTSPENDLANTASERVAHYNEQYNEFSDKYGKISAETNETARAISDYHKQQIEKASVLIERNPSASNYLSRGSVYGSLGQYDKAVSDYSQAIEIDEYYAEAYFRRGCTYYATRQYEEAVSDYTKAIAIDAHYVEACFRRGRTYYATGQYEEALKDYTTAIGLSKDQEAKLLYEDILYKVYESRAKLYDNVLHLYDLAIEDYTKAIEIRGDDLLYWSRGRCYLRNGNYSEAVNDSNFAIALDPDEFNYVLRGDSRLFLKQYDLALSDYTKAITLSQESEVDGKINFKNYDENEVNKMIADLTSMINSSQADSEDYVARGDAYFRLLQYENAIRDFTAAIDLGNSDYSAHIKRKIAHMRLRQYDKVLEDIL